MRAYEVYVVVDGKTIKGYAGTQGEAKTARQTLVDNHGVKKSSVSITDVDIPTDKAGLLAFVNKLVGAV